MLKIAMPTSFEDRLLDILAEHNDRYADRGTRIAELYGSLALSPTGVGRPQRSLARIERSSYERHIQKVREKGFGYNHLMNSSCTANREFIPESRGQMIDELLWARDIGCTAIVVASPYLIDLTHKHVPELRIHVSSIAFVKSSKEAKHYLRRGASRLILDPDTIRDFPFISQLRRECPELELEALCNHPCLLNCPYETYCYNSVSHASTEGENSAYQCYSILSCNLDKLNDLADFVKGSWFRPQDSHLYESAGVGVVKIAGRGRSTDWLAMAAEAYLSREYRGDMMALIWEAQWVAAGRSTAKGGLPKFPIRAPAENFEGFLDLFIRNPPNCKDGCGQCRHCDVFAKQALVVDEKNRAESRRSLEAAMDTLLLDARS